MFASRAPHATALVHSRVVPIAARCDCATPPAGSQHAGTPGAPPALSSAVIASSRDRLANVGDDPVQRIPQSFRDQTPPAVSVNTATAGACSPARSQPRSTHSETSREGRRRNGTQRTSNTALDQDKLGKV